MENKEYLFEEMPMGKAFLKLSLPTVAGCLVMILYNLADTYFVGMINSPIETAAVTLGATVILAFNAVTNLFGVGSSSLMSRALGVKDYDTFKRTSSFAFYSGLIVSIIFSICVAIFNEPLLRLIGADSSNAACTSDYLFWTVVCGAVPAIMNVIMSNLIRSEGSALHASIGSMSGCLLNIILDPFFILPRGLNMGAAGAGMATFISNCVALSYFLIYLLVMRKKTYVTIHPKYMRPNKSIVKDICIVGIPASIQNLLNVTGMTVLNNFMAVYGSEAVAAAGISHKTTLIPMYVAMGIMQGVVPLIGYNFSSGNKKRMKEAIVFTIRVGMTFMLLATVSMYIFSGQITGLFMENETIVAYGARFMRGMCLAQPFMTVDFGLVAVFNACGMGQKSFIFAILRKIVFEIPALIVLNKIFPMYGLAYAQLVAEFLLSIISAVILWDMLKNQKINPPKKED